MLAVRSQGADGLLAVLGGMTRESPAFRAAMRQATFVVRDALRRDLREGRVLHRRTGRLARSVTGLVRQGPGGLQGEVRPKAFYAPALEFGATIHAREATGRLHFPLGVTLGADGAVTGAAAAGLYRASRKGDPASWRGGARLRMSRAFRTALSAGSAAVLWRSPATVRLPARDFLAPAIDATADTVTSLLGDGFMPRQVLRGRT